MGQSRSSRRNAKGGKGSRRNFTATSDYNPEKPKPQPELLKRVIDSRLWGSSSELSNIKIDIEEGEAKVKELDLLDHEEQIFFVRTPTYIT